MKEKLTREERKDETRDKIIAEARDIFIQKGYARAQMKEVYERTGIGKKTLYRYFSSKVDLALAVETRILRELMDNVWTADDILGDGDLTAYEKLEKIYLDMLPAFINDNAELFKFTAQFDVNVTGVHDELESGREFTGYIKGMKDIAGDLITEGQADGSIRRDIDPRRTSIAGNNALMGLILRVFAREENLIHEQGAGREMIRWHIAMFLDYIKAR